MMRKLMAVLVALMLGVLLPVNASAYSYSYASRATVTSVDSTLLSLLNKERTSRGLRPLQADPALATLARMKSQDMVARNYFNHTSPTYGSPSQMLARNGVRYRLFAENIAKGSDAYRIHAMWMSSPGHRANILNPSLTHVGIGSAQTKTGGYAATQLFVGR